METRNDLDYANSQPNENELMEKKIDNYIEWFRVDCSDPHGELKWLIDSLLNSEHQEDMESVLNDTYELYKSTKIK
jgi:hypothetical protein